VSGEGLTTAVRQALTEAGIEFNQLEFVISDLNGERFKFKEAMICAGRLDRLRPEGQPSRRFGNLAIWHPIEFVGEIGAAIFPCMLGWAFEAGRKGYNPGMDCLLYAGEDSGERVALATRMRVEAA
jgi:3-oxoacyl-[acyl-carrier-protein] synthase-1